jgi:ubiquinone biosynthesis protein UbiJ
MLESFNALLGQAAVERVTLVINHVLASEPAATQKLRAHAGRRIHLQFNGWPAVLPRWPATNFLVTPAGLLEWLGPQDAAAGLEETPLADLEVRVDVSNPALAFAQALGGVRPKVSVAGDAAFAGDLNWLFDNLRWDVQDDLARVVGAAPARELTRLGATIAAAVREAVRTLSGLVQRGAAAGGFGSGGTSAAEPPPR